VGTKSANRQFLVKVEGIDGFFATKSGGEVTADSSKVWDGGSLKPSVLASPPEVGDVTCSRPYDRTRDQPMLDRLILMVSSWTTTVSVTPTDGALNVIPGTKPRVYSGALLTGVREVEPDASSGDASDLELTFAVEDIS
jgi:hypothetical protein